MSAYMKERVKKNGREEEEEDRRGRWKWREKEEGGKVKQSGKNRKKGGRGWRMERWRDHKNNMKEK